MAFLYLSYLPGCNHDLSTTQKRSGWTLNLQPQVPLRLLCDLAFLAFVPLSECAVAHWQSLSERKQGTEEVGNGPMC